jgi:hypothetical protein
MVIAVNTIAVKIEKHKHKEKATSVKRKEMSKIIITYSKF